MQLTAQALLVEDMFGQPVHGARVRTSEGSWFAIEITADDKSAVTALLVEMQQMVTEEILPSPTPHAKKCTSCEYRLLCIDGDLDE